jgi:hypothetical protein
MSKLYRALLVADLHFDSIPEHDYRYRIFSVLRSLAVSRAVDAIFILGDITEEKDNHPSVVVNKIVRGINSLEQIVLNHSKMSKAIPKLYILKGNHDFIDEHLPYFGFLENVFQNIVYIQNPCTISDNMGFVPYIKEATRILDLSKLILYTNVMFMHQPVVGALMNKQIGMKDGLDLTGIDTPIF